jgi:hypothetical protein
MYRIIQNAREQIATISLYKALLGVSRMYVYNNTKCSETRLQQHKHISKTLVPSECQKVFGNR